MITLFHCVGARSFRPLWMLEELALPYDLKVLPFPPRVHAREYLALNPLGTIPLFLDGEVRMTESAAICEYLAARYGSGALTVGSDAADFGAYLNWLHFGEATLTFPQALILRYSRFESEARRNPQIVQDYTRWFLARLRAVEAVVATQEFMCGQRFTAADVSVGFAAMLAEHIGLRDELPAAVSRYGSRLQQRPAVQRALAAERSAAIEQGVSALSAAQGSERL
jgi:glutathione S-transferase